MGTKFVLTTQSRNIINNYEVNSTIEDICKSYPAFETYIRANIRNYMVKKFPCIKISEENAHKIYQDFHKDLSLSNPELLIAQSKGSIEFHQIILGPQLMLQIQQSMNYLTEFKIDPKASLDVNELCRRADHWTKEEMFKKDTAEGDTQILQLLSDGYFWVVLKDNQAFKREAALMKNCVRNYYDTHILGDSKIYSLRTPENKPVITMEIKGRSVIQIKGVANSPSYPYEKQINQFIKSFKLDKQLHMSDFEMNQFNPIANFLPYQNLQLIEESAMGSRILRLVIRIIMFWI